VVYILYTMKSNGPDGAPRSSVAIVTRTLAGADGDGYPTAPNGDPATIRYCTKSRSDGRACRGRALIGMDVCYFHGGAAAGSTVRTVKRIQFGAQALTAAYGAPHEVDPADALLQELWRTNGHVLWLQERLLTADPDAFAFQLWRMAEELSAGTTTAPVKPEQEAAYPDAYLAVWHKLYLEERRHLVNAARESIRADATGALARLTEAQGILFAGVLQQLIDKMEPSAAQRTIVGEVLPTLMQQLVTGSALADDGDDAGS
jgi:hypothetical protein